jgi:hypothetical protein
VHEHYPALPEPVTLPQQAVVRLLPTRITDSDSLMAQPNPDATNKRRTS